jgi:hypothetical protein
MDTEDTPYLDALSCCSVLVTALLGAASIVVLML